VALLNLLALTLAMLTVAYRRRNQGIESHPALRTKLNGAGTPPVS
jgi:hypothetical protein